MAQNVPKTIAQTASSAHNVPSHVGKVAKMDIVIANSAFASVLPAFLVPIAISRARCGHTERIVGWRVVAHEKEATNAIHRLANANAVRVSMARCAGDNASQGILASIAFNNAAVNATVAFAIRSAENAAMTILAAATMMMMMAATGDSTNACQAIGVQTAKKHVPAAHLVAIVHTNVPAPPPACAIRPAAFAFTPIVSQGSSVPIVRLRAIVTTMRAVIH